MGTPSDMIILCRTASLSVIHGLGMSESANPPKPLDMSEYLAAFPLALTECC